MAEREGLLASAVAEPDWLPVAVRDSCEQVGEAEDVPVSVPRALTVRVRVERLDADPVRGAVAVRVARGEAEEEAVIVRVGVLRELRVAKPLAVGMDEGVLVSVTVPVARLVRVPERMALAVAERRLEAVPEAVRVAWRRRARTRGG